MPIKEIKSDSFDIARFIKNVIMGLVLGLIICFVLIIIFSFILTNDSSDMNLNNIAFLLGNIAIAVSVFVSGMFASIRNRNKGLVTGILCGLTFFIMLAFMTLLIPGSVDRGSGAVNGILKVIILFLNTLFFGGFGGVFGVNIGKRRKRS